MSKDIGLNELAEDGKDWRACIDAQQMYCTQHKVPHFAPFDGHCYSCGRFIYGGDGYSLVYARSNLITHCPYCMASYCD